MVRLYTIIISNTIYNVGEMAQGFRVLAAFSEDMSSILSIRVAAHKSVIFTFSNTLFWPLWASDIHAGKTPTSVK